MFFKKTEQDPKYVQKEAEKWGLSPKEYVNALKKGLLLENEQTTV